MCGHTDPIQVSPSCCVCVRCAQCCGTVHCVCVCVCVQSGGGRGSASAQHCAISAGALGLPPLRAHMAAEQLLEEDLFGDYVSDTEDPAPAAAGEKRSVPEAAEARPAKALVSSAVGKGAGRCMADAERPAKVPRRSGAGIAAAAHVFSWWWQYRLAQGLARGKSWRCQSSHKQRHRERSTLRDLCRRFAVVRGGECK